MFLLLLTGPCVQLPCVLSMRAGPGRSVGGAKALLQLGRPLVHLDRPQMRRQLPAFGQRSPLVYADGSSIWLLGGHLLAVVERLVGMLDRLCRQPPKAVKHVAVVVALSRHGCRLPNRERARQSLGPPSRAWRPIGALASPTARWPGPCWVPPHRSPEAPADRE